MSNTNSKGDRDTGATGETSSLVKSQPVGRMDPAEKRVAFLRLKELNDNGALIPPDRKKFSRKEREAVAAAYSGLCARCEEPLRPGFHIDHILERDLMGPDDLSNLVPLHPECHQPKTSARAPVLAKVHRLFKATFGAEPNKPSRFPARPFPLSRGFDKSKRKRMNGQVVARERG